jgi:ParB-like chromosome segregation protein Spo0J
MKLQVEYVKIEALIPYARNAKKHDAAQVALIAGSIKEFGFNAPVAVRGNPPVICAGHGRILAARKLGLTEAPCVRLDHLSETQMRAYIIADNKLSEKGGGWDEEMLKTEIEELILAGVEVGKIGLDASDLGEDDATYTRKVEAPKYIPKGVKPSVAELYDEAKTERIVKKIQSSAVEQSTKNFLIAAAHRHTVFNFENVAEFYAHSEPQVQRLMEDSALVIIDFDKSIENGFVVMTDEIKEAFAGDHNDADE